MTPKRVEQVMSRAVATCRPSDRLDTAARIMWDRDCGIVPVTMPEEGGERVIGMVTDRDICMAAYTQGRPLADIEVGTAMASDVRTCGPRDSIQGALKIMATCQVHRLPVIDDEGHIVGVLSLADVARQDQRDSTVMTRLASTMEALSVSRAHEIVPVAAA